VKEAALERAEMLRYDDGDEIHMWFGSVLAF